MRQRAIIFYGPPGSGKGTQATILSYKLHEVIHFDTGSYLERYLHDPDNIKKPNVKTAKKIFDEGGLISSDFTLNLVKDRVKQIHRAGFGVILSGSPRTIYEAFGDKKKSGVIETLIKLYGKENVFVFSLKIPLETSLKRNQARLISPLLNMPIMGTTHKLKTSPFTGEKLVRRKSLDNPKIIKHRLEEYKERTEPLEKALRDKKIKVIPVDGTPLPYRVFASIIKHLL